MNNLSTHTVIIFILISFNLNLKKYLRLAKSSKYCCSAITEVNTI